LLYVLILSSLSVATESTSSCGESADAGTTKSSKAEPMRDRVEATEATTKKRLSDSATAGNGSKSVSPTEHNNRAVELGSKGLWQDAIREHLAAVQGDPESHYFRTNLSSAYLHYADILASRKDWNEAIKNYREALHSDPNNAPAAAHLDYSLKAIGKNPVDYSTRAGIADDAREAGDWSTAEVEYRRCIAMKDSAVLRFRLGSVLNKQGKLAEAFEELRAAINMKWAASENSECSDCHCMMGDILWNVTLKAKKEERSEVYLKRLNNAGLCYKRAVTINPANESAMQGMINVGREIKDEGNP
jgi:tetratricopeptide (TPR) repeat protein